MVRGIVVYDCYYENNMTWWPVNLLICIQQATTWAVLPDFSSPLLLYSHFPLLSPLLTLLHPQWPSWFSETLQTCFYLLFLPGMSSPYILKCFTWKVPSWRGLPWLAYPRCHHLLDISFTSYLPHDCLFHTSQCLSHNIFYLFTLLTSSIFSTKM